MVEKDGLTPVKRREVDISQDVTAPANGATATTILHNTSYKKDLPQPKPNSSNNSIDSGVHNKTDRDAAEAESAKEAED